MRGAVWLVLLAGCAPKQAVLPTPARVHLDLSALSGGSNSMGLVDRRLVHDSLLERVRLDASVLSSMREDSTMEGWARRILIGALTRRGGTIQGPLPAGMTEAEPTAALRDAYFGIHTDEVELIVTGSGRDYEVSIATGPARDSLCPDNPRVTLTYVGLHGTLTRPDGSVVAIWEENALPTLTEEQRLIAVSVDPQALCEALPAIVGAIEPTDAALQQAALFAATQAVELVEPSAPISRDTGSSAISPP